MLLPHSQSLPWHQTVSVFFFFMLTPSGNSIMLHDDSHTHTGCRMREERKNRRQGERTIFTMSLCSHTPRITSDRHTGFWPRAEFSFSFRLPLLPFASHSSTRDDVLDELCDRRSCTTRSSVIRGRHPVLVFWRRESLIHITSHAVTGSHHLVHHST